MTVNDSLNNREYKKFIVDSDNPSISTVRVGLNGDVSDGYSVAQGAFQMSEVAPALLQTLEVVLHDGITATSDGSIINVSDMSTHTFQFDMGTSFTGAIEASLDGTNFHSIYSGLSDDTIVSFDGKYKYLRVPISAVSGALTVRYIGGH